MSKIDASNPKQITIDVPELRFPGGRPQSYYWLHPAKNLETGYEIGGDRDPFEGLL